MSLNSDNQENHLYNEDSDTCVIYHNNERFEYNNSDFISFYEDLLHRLKTKNLHYRSLNIFAHAMHEHLENPFKYNHCYQAAAAGDLIQLQKMHQHGLPLFSEGTDWEGDPETKYCTIEAAENGHLDCLRYAHENGCEWRCTASTAAKNGHLDCLRYAHENGCEWDESTTKYAAQNGHLDCLRYAHENGCAWHEETTSEAAYYGHLDCLRYAHENGCAWHEKTTTNAVCHAWEGHYLDPIKIEKNYLDCLRYAHENGCPWDKKTITTITSYPWELTPSTAARNGLLDCLKYAHENGCQWDEWTTSSAADNGHVDCFRYAYENGCPINEKHVDFCKQLYKDIDSSKNIIKKSTNNQLNDNVINHIINKYI
jgi:hypothetical protein